MDPSSQTAWLEKEPLLEPRPELTLDELRQNVQDTRTRFEEATKDAREALVEANKAYHKAYLKTPSGRFFKWVAYIAGGIMGIFALFCIGFVFFVFGLSIYEGINGSPEEEYLPRRVPLEAHIMSKCPDARDCLRDLVLPTMQNASHMVDFKLSYIGTPTNHDDGIVCKHGQEECLGNIVELCAASLYPNPRINLGFTMCLSRQYQDIPQEDLIKDCALEHGMSFESLNSCMSKDDGEFGMSMLRDSAQRSADANVTRSCTIRLDGKTRCIMDGGKWKDCEDGHQPGDLIADILQLRHQHSPAFLEMQEQEA